MFVRPCRLTDRVTDRLSEGRAVAQPLTQRAHALSLNLGLISIFFLRSFRDAMAACDRSRFLGVGPVCRLHWMRSFAGARFKINHAHHVVYLLSCCRDPCVRGEWRNIGGQRLGLTGGFCFVLLCFALLALLCFAVLALSWRAD